MTTPLRVDLIRRGAAEALAAALNQLEPQNRDEWLAAIIAHAIECYRITKGERAVINLLLSTADDHLRDGLDQLSPGDDD